MEFWGIEAKAKVPCSVPVMSGSIVHLSQATLSDIKKDTDTVTVHVEVGGKKLVLGMLSPKTPQLSFDLVFDDDFVISHNCKNGSIHLMGYVAETESDAHLYSSDGEDDEEIPVAKENGHLAAPAAKAPVVKAKQDNKPKAAEKEETEDDDSDDSSDELDSDGDSEADSDEEMATADSDSDADDSDSDEEDSEESEDEKPVKKADSGKKRSNADVKTPPQAKKAKIATPQKTDGKKGIVHPATPHPSKKGEKTPKSAGDKAGKSDAKTPKSGGAKSPKSGGSGSDLSCGPCKKSFKSDSAYQAHTKAKHAK